MSGARGGRGRALVLALVIGLSLAQLYVEYLAHMVESGNVQAPRAFIEGELAKRHDAVLDHVVGDQWRFRLLSDWGAEAFRRVARAAGFSQPAVVGFLAPYAVVLVPGALVSLGGLERREDALPA